MKTLTRVGLINSGPRVPISELGEDPLRTEAAWYLRRGAGRRHWWTPATPDLLRTRPGLSLPRHRGRQGALKQNSETVCHAAKRMLSFFWVKKAVIWSQVDDLDESKLVCSLNDYWHVVRVKGWWYSYSINKLMFSLFFVAHVQILNLNFPFE